MKFVGNFKDGELAVFNMMRNWEIIFLKLRRFIITETTPSTKDNDDGELIEGNLGMNLVIYVGRFINSTRSGIGKNVSWPDYQQLMMSGCESLSFLDAILNDKLEPACATN